MDFSTMVGMLFEGFGTTLQIFLLTLVGAIPLGIPIALARMSRFKPLSLLARAYISILRGTPLMLQMFAIDFCAVLRCLASSSHQTRNGMPLSQLLSSTTLLTLPRDLPLGH